MNNKKEITSNHEEDIFNIINFSWFVYWLLLIKEETYTVTILIFGASTEVPKMTVYMILYYTASLRWSNNVIAKIFIVIVSLPHTFVIDEIQGKKKNPETLPFF